MTWNGNKLKETWLNDKECVQIEGNIIDDNTLLKYNL